MPTAGRYGRCGEMWWAVCPQCPPKGRRDAPALERRCCSKTDDSGGTKTPPLPCPLRLLKRMGVVGRRPPPVATASRRARPTGWRAAAVTPSANPDTRVGELLRLRLYGESTDTSGPCPASRRCPASLRRCPRRARGTALQALSGPPAARRFPPSRTPPRGRETRARVAATTAGSPSVRATGSPLLAFYRTCTVGSRRVYGQERRVSP